MHIINQSATRGGVEMPTEERIEKRKAELERYRRMKEAWQWRRWMGKRSQLRPWKLETLGDFIRKIVGHLLGSRGKLICTEFERCLRSSEFITVSSGFQPHVPSKQLVIADALAAPGDAERHLVAAP